MNKENKNKLQLPYNLDIKLFEDILNDLKNTGQNGIKLGTLWVNVGAAKNLNRSYTLNMAKFLNLVDSDSTNVWLTDFGLQSFKYSSGDKRRSLLARKMPPDYLSIFKWIKNTGELSTSDLKGKFIENYGAPDSTLILDKAIASFLTYCDYLKIIKYTGKGNAAKAAVTQFGDTVLDGNEELDSNSNQDEKEGKIEKLNKKLILPEGKYPVIIKTNDREFEWDVKTPEDWTVIDSVIASIKEGWKIKQQPENHSNHIKGEKGSLPST